MDKDLEQLLKRAAIPVGKRFLWMPDFNIFQIQKFRIRIIKVSSWALVAIFAIWFLSGLGSTQPVKVESADRNESLVEKVAQLVVLPDEKPLVATVSKIELLKGNMFFVGAKNGDKVLVFQKNNKAILYSSELGRVINVGSTEETEI